MSEADLVKEAKGYTGPASDAQQEVDAYLSSRGEQRPDTPLQRAMFMAMLPPNAREEAVQLFHQYDGHVVNMDEPVGPVNQAPAGPNFKPPLAVPDTGASAAEKGSGQVPPPSPKPGPQMATMSGANATQYGAANRQQSLAQTAGVVKNDVAARQGTAPLPDAQEQPTMNASVPPSGGGGGIIDPGVVPLRMSQSANQGVVEPEEAKALRQRAFADELQSTEEEAFHTKLRDTQILAQQNEQMKKLRDLAKEDQAFADRQARIAEESEARIKAAEQALKEAEVDPNFNPMREIIEGDDWGKKIMLGMGVLFGSMGEGMTGRPNQFFEQYEKSVNRKIDLMEKRYRARKDYLTAAQDGYSRMRQILQDEAATRAMIEARAWQMFALETDKIMQQYSIDMADPRAQMIKATIARKEREAVMQSARTTNHTVGMQEQQKQLLAVSGGEDKTGDYMKDIVAAREAKKLPLIEGVLDNIATAVTSMSTDPSFQDQAAVILRTGTGSLSSLARYISKNDPAFQRISAAISDYSRTKAGTAQTERELKNLATLVGKGDLAALDEFYRIVHNERRAGESDIRRMPGYDEWERRGGAPMRDYSPRVDPIGSPAVK